MFCTLGYVECCVVRIQPSDLTKYYIFLPCLTITISLPRHLHSLFDQLVPSSTLLLYINVGSVTHIGKQFCDTPIAR